MSKKMEKIIARFRRHCIENIKIWCGKCQKKWKKSSRVSEDILLKT